MSVVEKHPLETFIGERVGRNPVPLKRTSYDIEVVSGLAIVHCSRVFRNDEERPIEATMTFPVPFEAVVYRIEARVDGRTLVGKAVAKAEARETYEKAMDDGKRTVLHEELLRGLHMVSVGNVAPGVEIEITTSFVLPVALAKGNGIFRIPLTVGQIYGTSPLEHSDDLAIGGQVQSVEVRIIADRGIVQIGEETIRNDGTTVQSNRPIEVRVLGLYEGSPERLEGFIISGRDIELEFRPIDRTDAPLKMHLLLDTSGSMAEAVVHGPARKSKWDMVLEGLDAVTDDVLGPLDQVVVSSFSDETTLHGTTTGDRLGAYVCGLPFISGGTDLSGAVDAVIRNKAEANVLLVTDGKSWNRIDIQKAITTGARFTVVLIGEDSLELNVGYLAAMTGGQMFVVRGADVRSAISAAVRSMRHVASPIKPITDQRPEVLIRRIAGVEIKAGLFKGLTSNRALRMPPRNDDEKRYAAGAFAASLEVQAMTHEELAADHAAEAGLVTHLTSVVLVDEAAESVDLIAATRKIALPEPVTASIQKVLRMPVMTRGVVNALSDPVFEEWSCTFPERPPVPSAVGVRNFRNPGARELVDAIDWDDAPEKLMEGDFSSQTEDVRLSAYFVSAGQDLVDLGKIMGEGELVALVAVLALHAKSPTAARIARTLLKDIDPDIVAKVAKALGF